MEIRDAVAADAAAACEIIRRSITELCVADHRHEPAILERWLANKTPEIVASWIAQTGSSVLVAVESGVILAVGGVTGGGEITLNYVSPDARFRGVSRAMVRALEARAIEQGNSRCTLFSTETARRFYQGAGYAEDGPPQRNFGIPSYPMSKRLAAARLERVVVGLPAGFETLRAEARAEGHRNLDRLAVDWASGAIRFDRPGEALLVAYVGDELAGVGGLTVDPAVKAAALRMRRFYVRKRFRRCGIGRRLAGALLERAVEGDRPVTVNAATGSVAFWEALGFVPDKRDGHTHKRRPG